MFLSSRRVLRAAGIALGEVMVAMLVLIVGLVATAQLLALSTVARTDAGTVTAATLDAQDKMDELLAAGYSALSLSATDTLGNDVPGFFDRTPAGRTRRWHVDAGPVADTRVVRVRVVSPQARRFGGQVELISMVRRQ